MREVSSYMETEPFVHGADRLNSRIRVIEEGIPWVPSDAPTLDAAEACTNGPFFRDDFSRRDIVRFNSAPVAVISANGNLDKDGFSRSLVVF